MTALTLFFVFVFSLSDYRDGPRVGWVEDDYSKPYSGLYEDLATEKNLTLVALDRMTGEKNLADMKLDYLIAISPASTQDKPQIQLLSLVDDMANVEARLKLQTLINRYFTNQEFADGIERSVVAMTGRPSREGTQKWFDLLKKTTVDKPTALLKIQQVGSSIWQNFDSKMHGLVGFSLMFSMFTLIFSVTDVLTDLKNHTWGRIQVSPQKKIGIVIGYFTPSVFLGFFQLSLLYLLGNVLFGIDFGTDLVGITSFLFLFSVAITSLAIFLASILRTRAQASAVITILINGTSMLGGCMWPLAVVESKFMLSLSLFMPQKWAIEAIEGMAMYGNQFSNYGLNALILLGMSLVFTVLGIVIFVRSNSGSVAIG
jgi:ABC-2 type transport system permease protein